MKHILIGVMVFAACVLLVQCRKPVFPNFDGGGNADFPDALTVTTGDNSKGEFNATVDGKLQYTWKNNDVLFVYSGKVEGDNFVGSKFLGKLDLIKGKNTYVGTFYGGTKKPAEGDTHLRFIHYGTSVTANDDGTASVSFASQTGTLAEISQKVVAVGEVEINKSGIYNECRLKPQFSVAMLKFTDFPGPGITVSGIAANQITVSNTGDVSFTVSSTKDGATMVLDNAVSTATVPVNEYYAVFMPENGKREHVFSSSVSGTDLSGTKSFKMSFQFTANGYYYGEGGQPFECKGTWEGGVLPGKFSVSSSKVKVQFSQGNLVYDNKKFYFHENQYDLLYYCDVIFYEDEKKADYVESGKFDMFGWGTGTDPYKIDADDSEYGPASGNLNDGGAFGSYYDNYDWGHNIGDEKTWFTLSKDQWVYLLGYNSNPPTCRETHVKVDGVEQTNWRFALVRIIGVGNYKYDHTGSDGVNGMIIFPDNFEWNTTTMGNAPQKINEQLFDPASGENELYRHWTDNLGDNKYTTKQFEAMQELGIVFLPASGYRYDHPNHKEYVGAVAKYNVYGRYATSTAGPGYQENKNTKVLSSYRLVFNAGGIVDGDHNYYRKIGHSVRLVRQCP